MTLYQRLALWLRLLADWCDPPPVIAVLPDPPYMSTPEFRLALSLAQGWRDNSTVSGEYKRHQVYATLIDAFPTTPRTTLGLRLEQAVQTLP